MKTLWQRWLVYARYVGDFQARALLTSFYFTLLAPFALVARWAGDPLRLRKVSRDSAWQARSTRDTDLDAARRQS